MFARWPLLPQAEGARRRRYDTSWISAFPEQALGEPAQVPQHGEPMSRYGIRDDLDEDLVQDRDHPVKPLRLVLGRGATGRSSGS